MEMKRQKDRNNEDEYDNEGDEDGDKKRESEKMIGSPYDRFERI